MAGISRRDLLYSGLALSAFSLLARSAWGRTAALLAGELQSSSMVRSSAARSRGSARA
jgi:beta-galactosidase